MQGEARTSELTAFVAVSHGLAHLSILMVPGLFVPIGEEFGMSLVELGDLGGVAPLLFGLGALLMGPLAGRIGSRPVFLLYFLGTAAAFLAAGLARSEWGLAVSMGAVGLFASAHHPVGASILSHNCPRVGKALGLHGIGGSLGIALYPLLSWGLFQLFGWRGALHAVAGLYLLMMLWSVRLSWHDGDHETRTGAGGRAYVWTPFLLLLVLNILFGLYNRMLENFLPRYFDEREVGEILRGGMSWLLSDGQGSARGFAETVATFALLAGIPGQYFGGILADRKGPEKTLLGVFLLSIPLALLLGGVGGWLQIPFALLFFPLLFAFQPLANTLIAVYTPPRYRASAYGLYFAVGFALGSFGSNAGGRLLEWYGPASLFFATAALIGVNAILTLVLFRFQKNRAI